MNYQVFNAFGLQPSLGAFGVCGASGVGSTVERVAYLAEGAEGGVVNDPEQPFGSLTAALQQLAIVYPDQAITCVFLSGGTFGLWQDLMLYEYVDPFDPFKLNEITMVGDGSVFLDLAINGSGADGGQGSPGMEGSIGGTGMDGRDGLSFSLIGVSVREVHVHGGNGGTGGSSDTGVGGDGGRGGNGGIITLSRGATIGTFGSNGGLGGSPGTGEGGSGVPGAEGNDGTTST